MAKSRNRTTGLPAPAKRDPAARKYRSRVEREAEMTRIVLIVSGVIAAIIVLILAGALFIEGVYLPNQPVAVVGGQNISTHDFQRRVVFERWRSGNFLGSVLNQFGSQYAQQLFGDTSNPYGQLYQQLASSTAFGQKVLTDMMNAVVIKEYAAANNITVSDDEINQQIYSSFGYQPTPMTATPTTTPSITPTEIITSTPTRTPTITPVPSITNTPTATPYPTGIPTVTPNPTQMRTQYDTDSQQYYAAAAKATDFTQAEIREVFTEDALQAKVKKAIVGAPQAQQEQVKARHILVATKEQADAAMKALQNGEPFANLAKAVSTDTGSSAKGGELGWAPKGQYLPEFDAAVWDDKAKIGDVLGRIQTTDGFHVIQLEGREMRTLSDSDQTTLQDKTFTDWLTAQSTTDKATQFDNWSDNVPSTPTIADLNLPDVQPAGGNNGLPAGFPTQ